MNIRLLDLINNPDGKKVVIPVEIDEPETLAERDSMKMFLSDLMLSGQKNPVFTATNNRKVAMEFYDTGMKDEQGKPLYSFNLKEVL